MKKLEVIAFRADASLQMGSGHVMRCLTLADALKAQGADCHFISREHPGHLLEVIRQRGYKVNSLAAPVQQAQAAIKNIVKDAPGPQREPAHTAWLGSTWQADAQETAAILATLQPDWMVVDHYALDQRWEEALAPHYRQLLVIDDLADRPHRCNLLLDQNLGRQPQAYAGLVPAHCQLLIGPHFALLRPEFAALRPYSLQRRRAQPALRQLLITMGGVDKDNATGQVLAALRQSALPDDCRITVVMGTTAPWLAEVEKQAQDMAWPTQVRVGVSDMAQLMADADLCIGAAGSTSWERCVLGLPCILLCVADNQKMVIQALSRQGVVMPLDIHALKKAGGRLLSDALNQAWLTAPLMVESAASVADGAGCSRVMDYLGRFNEFDRSDWC